MKAQIAQMKTKEDALVTLLHKYHLTLKKMKDKLNRYKLKTLDYKEFFKKYNELLGILTAGAPASSLRQ